jgi:hypothetical protein
MMAAASSRRCCSSARRSCFFVEHDAQPDKFGSYPRGRVVGRRHGDDRRLRRRVPASPPAGRVLGACSANARHRQLRAPTATPRAAFLRVSMVSASGADADIASTAPLLRPEPRPARSVAERPCTRRVCPPSRGRASSGRWCLVPAREVTSCVPSSDRPDRGQCESPTARAADRGPLALDAVQRRAPHRRRMPADVLRVRGRRRASAYGAVDGPRDSSTSASTSRPRWRRRCAGTPCRTYTQVFRVRTPRNDVYVPDVMVSCGPPPGETRCISTTRACSSRSSPRRRRAPTRWKACRLPGDPCRARLPHRGDRMARGPPPLARRRRRVGGARRSPARTASCRCRARLPTRC